MVLRDVIVHSARASLLALTLGAGGARGCCSSCGDSPSGCSYMPPPEPPLVEPGAACGYLGWGSPRCREGECLNGVCSARPPAPTCGEYAQPCCDSDGGSVCNAPFWCVDGGVCGVCGDPGSPCCYDRPACRAGAICESRQCVACGREGEPCCGGACSGSLTCDGRVCVPIFPCGEVDEACCAGGTCNDAWCVRTTEGDVCRACGGAQTPCCEDDACALGLLCGDAGRCAPPPRVFRPCDEDGTCPGAACISPEAASAFEGQGDASVDAAADLGDAPPADDATDAADSDTGDAADGAPRGACYPCGTLALRAQRHVLL
jgi:hypothetical protein